MRGVKKYCGRGKQCCHGFKGHDHKEDPRSHVTNLNKGEKNTMIKKKIAAMDLRGMTTRRIPAHIASPAHP